LLRADAAVGDQQVREQFEELINRSAGRRPVSTLLR
jgi:hypothetical protein